MPLPSDNVVVTGYFCAITLTVACTESSEYCCDSPTLNQQDCRYMRLDSLPYRMLKGRHPTWWILFFWVPAQRSKVLGASSGPMRLISFPYKKILNVFYDQPITISWLQDVLQASVLPETNNEWTSGLLARPYYHCNAILIGQNMLATWQLYLLVPSTQQV